jgi:hypothetical protein
VWLPWQWSTVLAAALAGVSVLVKRRTGRWSWVADFSTQAALIAALYSLWQLIASYTDRQVTGAVRHALWVWHLERQLGLPSERTMQSLILNHPLLVQACNVFYAQVHAPAVGLFLLWLFVRHRTRFAHYRNVLAVLTLVCLLAYLVPVAPPRLVGRLGMVDTGLAYHQSVYGQPGTGIADQLSAMPSVHMAWSLCAAWTVIRVSPSRWRWLIVAHPAVTLFVVVVTANHYWLDGVAAAVLLAWALAVATAIDRASLIVRTRRAGRSRIVAMPVLAEAEIGRTGGISPRSRPPD